MKFFDSCMRQVTIKDVADDIVSDMEFENRLKRLHEQREAEREAGQAVLHKENQEK